MELSDEQKKRIVEEEQQRLAEERYREQVRRELQIQSSAATPARRASNPTRTRNIVIVVGVFVILGVVALISLKKEPRPSRNEITSAGIADSADRLPLRPPQETLTTKPLPLPPQTLTTAQIAEKATPSVVVVENFNENGEKAGQGSGYVFSGDGIVVTNYHVIRGAKSLAVRVPGREPYRVDSVLGYASDRDVAALQVSDSSLTALTTESVDVPKVGDRVVAIGAPLGLENSVSEGIVSAIRDVGTMHILQTTASISPGSSGGPLLNEYGKVIGLTTATMVNGQSLNFVVSAKHISELLSRRQPMSLEEMLSQTRVSDPIASTTIMVPARSAMQLPFSVYGQQGAVLEGGYTITGGSGRDVGVALRGPSGIIVNSGRVTAYGQFNQRLPAGSYTIFFDNSFSTFSSKSVTPDLKLTYYR